MKGPWKVTSNPVGGRKVYGVYRIIDIAKVDHSGNRERYGDYVDTKEEAQAIADRLNVDK